MAYDRPFWLDDELDDEGFSTVGVAIAMLLALSLVFSGAQVYRVQSASAEIQEVADAAALSADNIVAEYYLVARVCDAVVLSLSLTGIVVTGIGVAALCTPLSASAGKTLIDAGERVLKARDQFANKAAAGLDKLQKLVPFLAAANAARVAASNGGQAGTGYVGIAITLPFEGEEVAVGDTGLSDDFVDAVDDAADGLEQAGKEAEDAARTAKESKERAYQADCGANPGYCMYERAATLAGLAGSDNPYFSSADTWGFSVALARAKAYYAQRLSKEAPQGSSVEEQAESALRKRFYEYAVSELEKGWVRESDDSFSANFPVMPRNTAELRNTSLFTESAYPVTVNESGAFEMHAYSGCPRAAGASMSASLAEREAGSYAVCPTCGFTTASLGKVAAASSSIDNGFEYHYRIVAKAAEEYQKAREAYTPKANKVRHIAGNLFDKAIEALKKMASQRIDVAPPGRFGVVAIVASTGSMSTDTGFSSSFVNWSGELGTRVAISGATLVSDSPEQGRTIIASALEGLKDRSDSLAVGALDGVMDVWSAALYAYADGQSRIGDALDELDSKLSFGSESGLGIWSSKEFSKLMESLGLQPVELDAPKPVLVNTQHVLEADSGAFSTRLLAVKSVASHLSGGSVLEGIIGGVEGEALECIDGFSGKLTIAEIEIAGEGSPTIPLTITLPDAVGEGATDLVSSIADRLRDLAGGVIEGRQWR